jgi:stalled ribosome alternative rescue factor ArfA
MRRKVSTLLDEALFRRVKLESARQGKQISEIVGEALEFYLAGKGSRQRAASVVAETWGSLPLDKDEARRVLTEEESFLDA